MALGPLHGPLKNSETSKTAPLVSWNVFFNSFCQNPKGYRNLFCIGNKCSCKTLSDNPEIAIIALVKEVVKIAIITSNKSDSRISWKNENAISWQPSCRLIGSMREKEGWRALHVLTKSIGQPRPPHGIKIYRSMCFSILLSRFFDRFCYSFTGSGGCTVHL